MKRLLVLAGLILLVLSPSARAEGPDDQYVQIYNLIQEGDAFSSDQPARALALYQGAQTALQKFQKTYPGWNDKIVNFRLNYLATKITILSAKVPAIVAPPPASAAAVEILTNRLTAPPAAAPAIVQTPPVDVNQLQRQLQSQIDVLQSQVKQIQSERASLEAKLKEALAAQPAAADPRELARAEEKIKALQKENDLLQVTVNQQQQAPPRPAPAPAPAPAAAFDTGALAQVKLELSDTKRKLAEQTDRATKLTQENQSLQARVKVLSADVEAVAALRKENEILKKLADAKSTVPAAAPVATAPGANPQLAEAQAQLAALQSDQEIWRLEKIALENRIRQLTASPVTTRVIPTPADTARVRQLELERDDLQKKLELAQKDLYGRNGQKTAGRIEELTGQLEVLRARLAVYEARQVPYSSEELALFKKPEVTLPVTDPNAGKKPVRELPAGTMTLVAEAQRDFAARQFEKAEEKYLEVLRRDNQNVNTLANLAAIQLEANHLDEAEKHLKEALAVAPDDAYSLSILGNLKYRQAKYDEALDVLSRAAKIEPQNAEIQNYLGLTLSQKGLRQPAETALRKAIQLQPRYGSAHNNLAVVYATQHPPSLELARWHYQRALDAGFPRNPDLEQILDGNKTADASK